MIVKGEDAPVTVCVTACTLQYPDAVKEVAAFRGSGVKVIVTAPSLCGLPVPTSVAVPIVGGYGAKKSFDDWLILPTCFDIYYSPLISITVTSRQRLAIRLRFLTLLLLSY